MEGVDVEIGVIGVTPKKRTFKKSLSPLRPLFALLTKYRR
jgi:hypothetical protein